MERSRIWVSTSRPYSSDPHKLRPFPMGPDFSPAWRWQLASRLAQTGRISRTTADADAWVRRAFLYLRRAKSSELDAERMAMTRRIYRDVYESEALHRSPIDTRWLVEALILSDMDASAMSIHLPIDADTVTAYEAIFYDLRPLLRYPSYILSRVLGPGLQHNDFGSTEMSWKTLAYLGGSEVLFRYLNPSLEPMASDAKLIQNLLKNRLIRNALTAAMDVKPDRFNAVDIQRVHIEFERGVAETRGPSQMGALQRGLVAALDAIRDTRTAPPDAPQLTDDGRYIEAMPMLRRERAEVLS